MSAARVALITGAGRRLGAAISAALHDAGYHVVLHCRQSVADAEALAESLNAKRTNSARVIQGELRDVAALPQLVATTFSFWGALDVLVNNASAFYPTPFEAATDAMWEELLGTNLKAPFFLARAAAPYLTNTGGTIVNLCDIHAEHTLEGYSIYSISKAGLVALTKSLAKELAPSVRVNGVAPGAILWPESASNPDEETKILARVPLARIGSPGDIANAVVFLVDRAPYVTGQILAVDGGRSLFN